ncbi:MAG: nucleotidyl transferase AbiEii/AbiGii toxin family protein [Deltaproteobacteria bacterium]|nr:nucleotidyl transferase AbiEii/AbiGii toxin family protein [Deltaproteobacteria bacterium]
MKFELSQIQLETLSHLAKAFESHEYVLIGATALNLQMHESPRSTEDFDFFVLLNVEDFRELKSILGGWRQKGDHIWYSSEDIRVDIIPICDEYMSGNDLTFPESGRVFDLTGYRAAFEHSLDLPLTDDLSVPVTPVHIIALLKIIAFLDKPFERQKDLMDIRFIFLNYVNDVDERRFEPEILETGIDYEFQPAYLLGVDLKNIVADEERELLDEFNKRAEDEDDEYQIQARLNRSSRMYPNETNTDALEFISAFKFGLGS